MKTINVGEVAVFDNVEPNKEQALKPLEEAAEVFGAWQKWNETKNIENATRIFEEIADTVQACVNLAAAVGAKDLTYAIENCKKRNIKRGRITKEEAIAIWNRRVVDTDELESVADELNVDLFLPDETYSCTVSTEETLKFEREMADRIRKAVGL